MDMAYSKESVAFLASEEEAVSWILSPVNPVDFLSNVLESCKDILAFPTIRFRDSPDYISSDKRLRNKWDILATLLLVCKQEVVDKQRCNLITCKKFIRCLLLILRNRNAKPVGIRICTENDIGTAAIETARFR